MNKTYKDIADEIRVRILYELKSRNMTQQDLLGKLQKYYVTEGCTDQAKNGISHNKLSRLLNKDGSSGAVDLDLELLYYVFKELDLRFDSFFFDDKGRMNFDYDKLNSLEFLNKKDIQLDSKYEEARKKSFIELFTTFEQNSINSEILSPVWKELAGKSYLSYLKPRIVITGKVASGTTTLIHLLLDTDLIPTSTNANFDSDLTYIIHSDYKPLFLSESQTRIKYKAEDFKIENINVPEELTESSENFVNVIFSDNELLKYITLVECKSSSKNFKQVMADSYRIIALENLTSRSSNMLSQFRKENIPEEKIQLICNKIPEGESIYNTDNGMIYYDAFDRNTYPRIINLFTSYIKSIQENIYCKENEPLALVFDIPMEYKMLPKNDYPGLFYEKLPEYWNDFLSKINNIFTEKTGIQARLDAYFDKYLNYTYLEDMNSWQRIIPKDSNTDILQVTKDNMKVLAEKINDDIHKYCLNRLFEVNESSYVYNEIFKNLKNPLYDYFYVIYENIANPLWSPKRSVVYEQIKDINSACRPKIKTISKRIFSKNNKEIKEETTKWVFETADEIYQQLLLRMEKSMVILNNMKKEAVKVNIKKLTIILDEIDRQKGDLQVDTIMSMLRI